ncbi:MAG: hypothetical protein KGL39_25225 [Patescibacteria group bacterium]|nr:hypothetical protein [Patescibacteria group bacterium]
MAGWRPHWRFAVDGVMASVAGRRLTRIWGWECIVHLLPDLRLTAARGYGSNWLSALRVHIVCAWPTTEYRWTKDGRLVRRAYWPLHVEIGSDLPKITRLLAGGHA